MVAQRIVTTGAAQPNNELLLAFSALEFLFAGTSP